jgi:TonB family protein
LPEASQQQIRDWLSGRVIAEEQALPSETPTQPELAEPAPRESSLTPPWLAAPAAPVETGGKVEVRVSTEVDVPARDWVAAEPASHATGSLPGAERDSKLVTDVRSALFQAVQAREAPRAPAPTPQQVALRQQRLRRLILGVAGGTLAGLAFVASAVFIREHSEQLLADLGGLKRSVAGLLESSQNVKPPVANVGQGAIRSLPPRRADSKGVNAASGAPGKADPTKPFQIEVVGPENRHHVVSSRGSPKIRVRFEGPSWKQAETPGAAGLESLSSAELASSGSVAAASVPATSQEATGEVPTQKIMPAYPLLALQKNIQGTVVLQATIGKDGSVQNVHLISVHPILATAVMDAVKQWRYKPVYRDGEPVEVQRRFTVDFVISTD